MANKASPLTRRPVGQRLAAAPVPGLGGVGVGIDRGRPAQRIPADEDAEHVQGAEARTGTAVIARAEPRTAATAATAVSRRAQPTATAVTERAGLGAAPAVADRGAKRRRRGRPKAGEADNVREKILTAARDLFVRYGYRAVSSRQIGAAAGVNFAMIRYYFGGKPGLYREILNGVIQPVRAGFEAMTAAREPVQLADFLAELVRAWSENPWMAGFVVREVLAPDGPMRAMYIREMADNNAPFAESVIKAAIETGQVRPEIDPKLLLLSLVSLGVFPFLAFPVTSRTFGVRNQDDEFIERFLRHTVDVLLNGVARKPQ